MVAPPTGTVTFLFTDIEGSTRMWEAHPRDMGRVVARHDEILGEAFERFNGYVFATGGDAFSAAFADPLDAARAAIESQEALRREEWPEPGPVQVRMALHTGIAEERGGDYFGPPLNRASRILSLADGGTVLTSETTAGLLRHHLPDRAALSDLGDRRLKDLEGMEHVYQLAFGDEAVARPSRRLYFLVGAALGAAALIILAVLAFVSSGDAPEAAPTPATTAPTGETPPETAAPPPASEELWSRALGGEPTGPVLAGGLVTVGASMSQLSGDGFVHGLVDGDDAWDAFQTFSPINREGLAEANSHVYMSTESDQLYGLDARSGTELWSATFPFITPTAPATDGEFVYVGAANVVYAYEADPSGGDAVERWSRNNVVLSEITVRPAVAGGFLFVADERAACTRRDDCSNVYAFDSATGATVWDAPVGVAAGLPNYNDRVLALTGIEVGVSRGGGVQAPEQQVWVFVNDLEGWLSAWEAATAEPVWGPEIVPAMSPPALGGRTLYVVSPAGILLPVSLAGAIGEPIGDVGPTTYVPVYEEDHDRLYLINDAGVLTVVDTVRQEVIWSQGLGLGPAGPVAVREGTVYVSLTDGTSDHRIVAIRPDL